MFYQRSLKLWSQDNATCLLRLNCHLSFFFFLTSSCSLPRLSKVFVHVHLFSSSTYHQTQCRGRVWSQPTASGTATLVSGLWPSVRLLRQPALSLQTGAQLALSMASLSLRVTATVPASHKTQVSRRVKWHFAAISMYCMTMWPSKVQRKGYFYQLIGSPMLYLSCTHR